MGELKERENHGYRIQNVTETQPIGNSKQSNNDCCLQLRSTYRAKQEPTLTERTVNACLVFCQLGMLLTGSLSFFQLASCGICIRMLVQPCSLWGRLLQAPTIQDWLDRLAGQQHALRRMRTRAPVEEIECCFAASARGKGEIPRGTQGRKLEADEQTTERIQSRRSE